MTPGEENEFAKKVREAEAETVAQLEVVRILGRLDRGQAEQVLMAVAHLMEADRFVPGVMDAVRHGLEQAKGGESCERAQ